MSIVLTVVLCSPNTALCSTENSQVIAPIEAAIEAGQTGDFDLLRNQYLPSITIIDEVPPFFWSGPNALDDYLKSFGNFYSRVKMTNVEVTTRRPEFVYSTQDSAYVILPFTSVSKVDGLPLSESGLLAFTLQKTNKGWKIRSQTSAKGNQTFSIRDPYR
jgi:hypothetical protein